MQDFINLENQLFSEDKQILEDKMIKNNLESLAYEIRNSVQEGKLNGNEKEEALGKVQETLDWLYDNQSGQHTVQLRERYSEFTQLMKRIRGY